jgi:hypothetical protein
VIVWIYCNPYCNRADTRWYTLDKTTPLENRKPPKQAQFPDAPVRARTYASKLVKRLGQRFESARRLSYFSPICRTIAKWLKPQDERWGPLYTNPYTNRGRHRPLWCFLIPPPAWSRRSWRGHAKDVAYLAAEEDAEPFERKMLRLVASCASSRPGPGA